MGTIPEKKRIVKLPMRKLQLEKQKQKHGVREGFYGKIISEHIYIYIYICFKIIIINF